MDKIRFTQLAEIYGGDIDRWPSDELAPARAFANAHSAWAADILTDAAALDAVLDQAPNQVPGAALVGAIMADFPGAAAENSTRAVAAMGSWISALGSAFAWRASGLAATLALCVGLGAGTLAGPPSNTTVDDDLGAASVLLEAALFDRESEWFDAG